MNYNSYKSSLIQTKVADKWECLVYGTEDKLYGAGDSEEGRRPDSTGPKRFGIHPGVCGGVSPDVHETVCEV